MAIDFPTSPSLDQEYTYLSRTWKWNGSGWQLVLVDPPKVGFDPTVTATSKTLVENEFCIVTAAGQTISLPTSPVAGNQVAIGVRNFANTVVGRNGQLIEGLTEDLTFDVPNSTYEFVFSGATYGWVLVH
jgi:hypothetical protein